MLLEGKVALVSGIGPGIGATTALTLASAGADVAIGARTESKLTELAAEIESLGRRCVWHPTDVTDDTACAALADRAASELGGIDVLVNNAFTHPRFTSVEESTASEWRVSMKVNVQGTLQMTQAALKHMDRGASIVMVNSMSARNSEPLSGAYAAAKAALFSMARTLCQEIGPRGIRVNSVVPGHVDGDSLDLYFDWLATDRDTTAGAIRDEVEAEAALRYIVTPTDVANAILFLASDLSSGITGAAIDVNGGSWLA